MVAIATSLLAGLLPDEMKSDARSARRRLIPVLTDYEEDVFDGRAFTPEGHESATMIPDREGSFAERLV